MEGSKVSKLLGAPFGMDITTEDTNGFLMAKIEKRLMYWITMRLNSARQEVITNNVLVSSLLYILAIWGGARLMGSNASLGR